MRLIKFISPFVLISFLCISFFSCSKDDNPIIPPVDTIYHYDSARYNWTADTLRFLESGNVYIPDTNNLYFLDLRNLIRVRHGAFEYLTPPFPSFGINGLDNNKIYLAGSQSFVGTKRNVIRVYKYDGSAFSDLMFPTDTVTSEYLINNITPFSESEVWFAGYFGSRVYKYDGSLFHRYDLDSGYRPTTYFIKNADGLFVCAVKYYQDGSNEYPDTLRVYKFDGAKFKSVYSRKTDITESSANTVNNIIYNLRGDGIYRFTGNNFVKIFSPVGSFGITIGGKNENDFMVTQTFDASFNVAVFHWNGIKWSREFPLSLLYTTAIYKKEKNYYVVRSDGYNSYFFTGRPKK